MLLYEIGLLLTASVSGFLSLGQLRHTPIMILVLYMLLFKITFINILLTIIPIYLLNNGIHIINYNLIEKNNVFHAIIPYFISKILLSGHIGLWFMVYFSQNLIVYLYLSVVLMNFIYYLLHGSIFAREYGHNYIHININTDNDPNVLKYSLITIAMIGYGILFNVLFLYFYPCLSKYCEIKTIMIINWIFMLIIFMVLIAKLR